MTKRQARSGHLDESVGFEVRLQGHLDARWAAWFDGLNLERGNDGTTVLRGPIADQAALHGLLRKINDLGLPLVSVFQIGASARDIPSTEPNQEPQAKT